MKKLVIVTHPNIENSQINKRWIEELNKFPEEFTVHQLYDAYPDEKIDVAYEQQLVESHDEVIFQFPMYWFSAPPLLKKWLDEVLIYGWAYGQEGNKLKDKKIALAMSIGIKEEDYAHDGRYHFTVEELTSPFKLTFIYTKSDYRPFFAFYGTENQQPEDLIAEGVNNYLKFARNL